MIVSKDCDSLHLSFRYDHPPRVDRLVAGNCTTDEIESLIQGHHEDLLASAGDEKEVYLELP